VSYAPARDTTQGFRLVKFDAERQGKGCFFVALRRSLRELSFPKRILRFLLPLSKLFFLGTTAVWPVSESAPSEFCLRGQTHFLYPARRLCLVIDAFFPMQNLRISRTLALPLSSLEQYATIRPRFLDDESAIQ